MAKEKCDKIILIEAWVAANSGLLARFTTKSRMILAIFTRHLSYAEVSNYLLLEFRIFKKMRLNAQEITAIKNSFKKIFKTGQIFLFGSRVDDDIRGGDIDLYIVAEMQTNLREKKLNFWWI